MIFGTPVVDSVRGKLRKLPPEDWLDSRASYASCDEVLVTILSHTDSQEIYKAFRTTTNGVTIFFILLVWQQDGSFIITYYAFVGSLNLSNMTSPNIVLPSPVFFD